MAGVMGIENNQCPYNGEVVEAAWEAGWEDGFGECKLITTPVGKLAS